MKDLKKKVYIYDAWKKKERNKHTNKQTEKRKKRKQKSKRERETISHVCTSTLFTQCCDRLIGPGPSHTSSYCSKTTHALPARYCSTEVLHAHMTTVTRVYIPFTKHRQILGLELPVEIHTCVCVCAQTIGRPALTTGLVIHQVIVAYTPVVSSVLTSFLPQVKLRF